ncbi:hypothetical protein CRG98_013255 [Punica granatum]|uniref:Uncharacterized protein n=1 Tax=Punica granatum TaxID=22663 RepID=A0A2I0KDV0_PUNGR|nr:hypothetical protein CRG98_013255 [Punica granatum]
MACDPRPMIGNPGVLHSTSFPYHDKVALPLKQICHVGTNLRQDEQLVDQCQLQEGAHPSTRRATKNAIRNWHERTLPWRGPGRGPVGLSRISIRQASRAHLRGQTVRRLHLSTARRTVTGGRSPAIFTLLHDKASRGPRANPPSQAKLTPRQLRATEHIPALQPSASTSTTEHVLPRRDCSSLHTLFYASQVRRAFSFVLLANLSDLLAHANSLLRFAISPSLLPNASCKSARPACPCTLSFTLRNFAEPARSWFLQICRTYSPVHNLFYASQVRRACSFVLLANLSGQLACAHSLLSFANFPSQFGRASCKSTGLPACAHSLLCFASSPRLLDHASCKLAGLIDRARSLLSFASWPSLFGRTSCKFVGLLARAHSLLRIASSPSRLTRAHNLFYASSVVLLVNQPGQLARAHFLSSFKISLSPLARASSKSVGPARPWTLSFTLPSQVGRACSVVLLVNQPGQLARAHFLSSFKISLSPLARASCKICRDCSPAQNLFYASQVRRACLLVLSANLPGLLTHGHSLLWFLSSPSLLARASCKYARTARPCTLSFILSLQVGRACSVVLLANLLGYASVHTLFYALQVRRACSIVLSANLPGLLAPGHSLLRFQVRRACSLVLLANLPGLLACAHSLLRFLSLPRLLAPTSCKYAGLARPCTFSFQRRKFAEPAPSCFLKICRACSPVHTLFYASRFRRACSLVLLANLLGLLARAHSLLGFADSLSFLASASCTSVGPSRSCTLSFTLRKSAKPARSCFMQINQASRPCTLSFMLRKFAEPAPSCFLKICRACSPVHTLFYASQFHQPCSLVLLTNLPGLLTRVHSLLRFVSPPSLLARASCKSTRLLVRAHSLLGFADSLSFLASASCTSVGPSRSCTLSFTLRNFSEPPRSPAHPCTLSFTLRKFAEPASSYFLQICRAWSPFPLSFTLRKFTEPARSCFLQICRTFLPVHTLFYASQVRRACSLVLLTNLPGLLTRVHSLYASQVRRACSLVLLTNLPGLLTRVHSLYASQVRRACSLVLLTNLPGLLARVHSLLRFASSPSLLARLLTRAHSRLGFADSLSYLASASCKSAGQLDRAYSLLRFASSPSLLSRSSCKSAWLARRCTFFFKLRKLAEPVRSCILQICRATPPCTLFYSSQVRRACSLVFSGNLRGLLAHPHSLSICNFTEPARSCFMQIFRESSLMHALFYASQVRRAFSFGLLAHLLGLLARAHSLLRFTSLPSLLARASCKSARPARLCTLPFTLLKFAETARSCFLQICRACMPVHILFSASQVRRAYSLVLLENLSPSLLAPAFWKSAGPARPCTLSLLLCNFADPTRSCFMQICRDCSLVHTLFYDSQVRQAFSFVLHAHLSGLLDRAHSLLRFAILPSQLARAFCKSFDPAGPCTLSFKLRKFAKPSRSCFLKSVATARHCTISYTLRTFPEPAPSCFLQICRAFSICFLQICRPCSPVHTLFYATQVRRACSIVLLATLSAHLVRAHFHLRFESSPSLLARATCKSVGLARPCTLSFTLRNFAEPASSCFLQICRASSPVHTLFYASQFCRASKLVLLANLSGLLARAHSLLRFAILPSQQARASCKSVGPPRPCTLSFTLRNFAEPASSCFLQICRASSPVHTLFYASQFCRASKLVLLANLSGLLARAHSLLRFAILPSQQARASCKSVGPPRPCTLSFTLRNFAEPASSCFLQICRASSPVHTLFYASQFCRACSPVLLANLSGLLDCAHYLLGFAASQVRRAFSLVLLENMLRLLAPAQSLLLFVRSPNLLPRAFCKSAEPARPCFLQICPACSPVPTLIYASKVCRASSLVLLENMLRLLAPAQSLLLFVRSPNLLPRAFCKSAEPARPCTLSLTLFKFAKHARSCFMQICQDS